MVRHPSPELVEASQDLVCVRVTDMKGIDLNTFVFDYDLTFAVLLMHPNGHVYHQYGNRTAESHDGYLSMASLARAMRATTADHEAYVASGAAAPVRGEPVGVEQLPAMAKRVAAGKGPECFHCHMVFQARDEEAQEKGTFDPGVAWRWPPSTRIGITLDRDDQQLVTAVEVGSPAAQAGLEVGDRLVSMRGAPVATEGDVQFLLDGFPASGGKLPVTFTRGDAEKAAVVELPDGWRVGTPDDLWRATMWRLSPKPGFGGPKLTDAEKEKLRIGADVGAFRVKYVVTWGPDAHTGRNAAQAGIQKGDVILSVAGKSDFRSPQNFHAWFRLTRKAGETVKVELLRKGERRTLDLPVVD